MLRKFIVAVLAATLAACVSTPPNPLTPAVRQTLFVRDSAITWSAQDGDDSDAFYVAERAAFRERLQTAVNAAFDNSPAGSEPVRFDIEVKQYSRVGMMVGNLLGGANVVLADVHVVRLSDGQRLGTYTDIMGRSATGGGVIGVLVQAATRPDVAQVMSDTFAANLRQRFDAER